MLKQEFEFYLKHQSELVEKYNHKYLVIKGEEVLGAYNTDKEAYLETSKTHKPGTFLIQLCEKGESAYSQTFHSRVSFA